MSSCCHWCYLHCSGCACQDAVLTTQYYDAVCHAASVAYVQTVALCPLVLAMHMGVQLPTYSPFLSLSYYLSCLTGTYMQRCCVLLCPKKAETDHGIKLKLLNVKRVYGEE